MAFWDDIKAAQKGFTDFLGEQNRQLGVAFGAPQISTQTAGDKIGDVSKDELKFLSEGMRKLSPTEQAYYQPQLDYIGKGGAGTRDVFNTLLGGMNTMGQEGQRNAQLKGIAGRLDNLFTTDPLLKKVSEGVTKGMNTDILNPADIERLANLANEPLAKQSEGAAQSVREDAANRGIYTSGGAISDELLTKANYAGQMSRNTGTIGLESKKLNEASKLNYSNIGAQLSALQGDLSKASAAIQTGQVIPSVHLDEINGIINGLADERKQLDYINQVSANGGMKDLLSTILGVGDSATSDAMGLFSLLKGSKTPKDNSVAAAGIGGLFTGGGTALGGWLS